MKPAHKIVAFIVIFGSLAWRDAAAQSQSQPVAGWQVLTHKDALSGKTITEIALDPTSDTDNEFNDTGIYIRCSATQELELYVGWDVKLTTDTSVQNYELDYRIGNSDVQNGNWDLSTDEEGQFYPDDVAKFINLLETSTVFVVQATPVGMSPISATYDTTGLSDAVAPVLQACGYNTN